MTARIEGVRHNIKEGYQAHGSPLYIHGITFEGDPVEYEYHSKAPQCKYVPGTEINFTVTTDKQGHPKIKLEREGGPPNRGTAAPRPNPPARGSVPAYAPSPNTAPFADTYLSISRAQPDPWLAVFSAICTLKSGTATPLDKVLEATETVVKRIRGKQ